MSNFSLSPSDAAVVLNALDGQILKLQGDIRQMEGQTWNNHGTSATQLELAAARKVYERIAAWAKEASQDVR